MGWLRRWKWLGVASPFVWLASVAHAQPEPTEGVGLARWLVDDPVPSDAPIVLHAYALDGVLDDELSEVEVVVEQDGMSVPGTVDAVALEQAEISPFGPAWLEILVVFHPSTPLAPGTYTATATVADSPFGPDPEVLAIDFSAIAGSVPALDISPAGVGELEIDLGDGDLVCCLKDTECGEVEECAYGRLRQRPLVRGGAEIPPELLPYVWGRVLKGVDGQADALAFAFGPGYAPIEGFTAAFAETASEYCMAIEITSLMDGSSIVSDIACAPDLGIDYGEELLDLSEWASNCLDDPYWQRTGEPWQPPEPPGGTGDTSGGADGDTTGDGVDGTGGPGSDDADGNATTAASEGDGATTGGPAADGGAASDGCGCTTAPRGLGLTWAIVVLGLLRRRAAVAG